MNNQLFSNTKVTIVFQPISNMSNDYCMVINANKRYYLEKRNNYFIPHFIQFGRYKSETQVTETITRGYQQFVNAIPLTMINKFMFIDMYCKYVFYGYFESIYKANREFHQNLLDDVIAFIKEKKMGRQQELIREVETFRLS